MVGIRAAPRVGGGGWLGVAGRFGGGSQAGAVVAGQSGGLAQRSRKVAISSSVGMGGRARSSQSQSGWVARTTVRLLAGSKRAAA